LHEAYYNKACSYALQSRGNLAIQSLRKAVKLFPDKYLKLARIDADFDSVRDNKNFQELVQ
jgi:hypothetical protein